LDHLPTVCSVALSYKRSPWNKGKYLWSSYFHVKIFCLQMRFKHAYSDYRNFLSNSFFCDPISVIQKDIQLILQCHWRLSIIVRACINCCVLHLTTLIHSILYNNPSNSCILIGSRLWSIRGQMHRWRQRSIQVFFNFLNFEFQPITILC